MNNLSAFVIGMFFTGIVVFVVTQSDMMTASIADSLWNSSSTTSKDITLSFQSGVLDAFVNRLLPLLSWQSIRIEFQYDSSYKTDTWILRSSYPHSFTFQDGVWTIIMAPWNTITPWKELFKLSTNLTHETTPIVTMLSWYWEGFIEPLDIEYAKDSIHY